MSKQIIDALWFLLPGFVASAVFYFLTSYYKPSPFERIVQALVFTYLIQGAIKYINDVTIFIDSINFLFKYNSFLIILLLAIVLGIAASVVASNDTIHRLLSYIKFPKEPFFSAKSQWMKAFTDSVNKHLVLHLNNDKRIYGRLKEWPTDLERGYFLLQEVNWLGEDNEYIPMEGVESMLIPSGDVKRVEFMKPELEENI